MTDRPKRERKPTTFFQYRDTSGESTIANVGGSSKRRPATEAPNAHKTKREDTESPNKGTSGSRGRNRGGGRGRGATGRGGLRSSSVGGSRRSLTQNTDEQLDNEVAAFFTDTTDAGAHLNENDDPNFEAYSGTPFKNSAKKAQRNLKPPSGRKLLANSNVVSRLPTDGDEVIEQWYADPYERVNPDNAAYDQWRLQNLQISLQNQGYSIVNSKQMAAWLMKCDGHFMEFNAPVRKSRAKKSEQSLTQNDDKINTVVPDVDAQQDEGDENDGISDHVSEDSEQTSKQSEANATFAAFKTAISSRLMGSISSIQGHHTSTQDKTGSVVPNGSSKEKCIETDGGTMNISEAAADEEQDEGEDAEGTQPKKTSKLSDKYELENLKRCLNVFNSVYGAQGPQGNPARFELNHFSQTSAIPVLKPKAGLRTQAHYVLQEVLLPADNLAFFNGIKDLGRFDQELPTSQDGLTQKVRKVLTEDPDFGLTVVPESERATEADMKLYYAQFARDEAGQRKLNDISDDRDTPEDEEEMTKEQRHVLSKERNLESATLISEQLTHKLFDWETPLTMRGSEPPKQFKDDKMQPGAFALQERHVWKEIRRRQEILDEGGEGAARLLEQEWEDEQAEIRREERRRQNAMGRARRREKLEEEASGRGVGIGEMDRHGRRKRVKFSAWIAEG